MGIQIRSTTAEGDNKRNTHNSKHNDNAKYEISKYQISFQSEIQEHRKTKSGQRDTGKWDELATGETCCTRQTRKATFGFWLHWDSIGLSHFNRL